MKTFKEFENLSQREGHRRRRWFCSDDEDLIVWFSDDGSIYGFQLCYDRQRHERALTWLPSEGFAHTRVDDGEGIGFAHKRTPVLTPDGTFDAGKVLKRFSQSSSTLPKEIENFVAAKLRELTVRAPEKGQKKEQ